MNKKNRKLVAVISVISLVVLGFLSNVKFRNYISTGIFSKDLADKTKVTVKADGRNENNVIYINLDGFSYDTFVKANKNPLTDLENIKDLIDQGVLFTNAKTGIPSITDSMQQSIASGAWPIDTGNCYRFYDLEKDQVIEYKRDNKLENIAEAANKNNISLLSINGWFFKENGANEESENLYIEAPNDGAYKDRFELLKKVLKGEEIEAYGKRIKYEAPPQFISIYADDIDAAAHNLNDKMSTSSKVDLETRDEVDKKMIDALVGIDKEIGEVMDILKERKLFDKTTFVITTDHGMVPYGMDTKDEPEKDWAKSKMPDLLESIEKVGQKHIGRDYRVEMVNDEGDSAKPETEVIVTTVGLQAQIKFRGESKREVLEDIVESIREKPYYGEHMYDDELRIRGTLPRFADLLISPKPPYHFSQDFKRKYYAVNQHDSLAEGAQRIFTMISGPTVKGEEYFEGEVYNIDIAPTIARILGFEGPEDRTSSAIDAVLIDKLKGPKLGVSNFRGNSVYVDESEITLNIETEPNAEVIINKKSVGTSDKRGDYTVVENLENDVNRFIIEVKKDKKSTRRVFFVIKNIKS